MIFRSAILGVFICIAWPCYGFDLSNLSHTPPLIAEGASASETLTLTASSPQIKEMRVLVPGDRGVNTFPMHQEGKAFVATLKLKDIPFSKYQFQVRSSTGEVFETDAYYLDRKISPDVEKELQSLRDESTRLEAEVSQREQALANIKLADPKTLGKNKNQELGKALVLLGQKEREYSELKSNTPKAGNDKGGE